LRRHPAFPLRLVLLAFLFFLHPALVFSRLQQPSGNVIRFVRNPDAAPDFKLGDLDGKPLTLAAAHGKVVLLNFWATWCGPCREEIPDLIALQAKYKDNLQIIGISVDDDEADIVKKVVEQTGINLGAHPQTLVMNVDLIQFNGPVPEPTTLLGLSAAVGIMMMRRRR